jgi:phosphoribosyl 1,2-cyclic phosphodiesterase
MTDIPNIIAKSSSDPATVCVIASGSSGNSVFIQSGDTRILVDIGVTCKRVESALYSIGVNPHDIDAVFITHEHTDHISGLPVFQRRYHIPIYTTSGTLKGIPTIDEISDECEIVTIRQSSTHRINGSEINTFKTNHDAAAPIGLTVTGGGFKVSLATDLGVVSKTVFEHLSNSNVMVFESNYDEKMLVDGRYPWFLKKRIMSENGHLSNIDSSNALLELNWKGLSRVYLAHISRNNNTHQLVSANVKKAFSCIKHPPEFLPANHDRPTSIFKNY